MIGCRPLTDVEVRRVCACLSGGGLALRDRALFVLGVKAGFRIAELLSLTLGDVVETVTDSRGRPWTRIVDRVTVARRNMKQTAQVRSRSVPLHRDVRAVLAALGDDLSARGYRLREHFLFQARGWRNQALSPRHALRRLHRAFSLAGLSGRLATHSMRKTFAQRMHRLFKGDLTKTAAAMGHNDVRSTARYISFKDEDIDKAILSTPSVLGGGMKQRKVRKAAGSCQSRHSRVKQGKNG